MAFSLPVGEKLISIVVIPEGISSRELRNPVVVVVVVFYENMC